ncbi:putative oxidoreductase [Bacillus sp. 349Y]|nr:putative oxidoreductase [Bacillus sp. 349Y]
MNCLDAVIIGAGQAGLSLGYYLKNSGLDFLILDKNDAVGMSWKLRYDSLVLFTPKEYSSLPGLKMKGESHEFPTKDEVESYLQYYAEKFSLPVRLNEAVIDVTTFEGTYIIKTHTNEYRSKNIIIATGPFNQPFLPGEREEIAEGIMQIHSSDYKNPDQLKEGNVLVVGGGNSGAQIAVEVSKHNETFLSISQPLHFLPLTVWRNRSIFWLFDKLGILNVTSTSFIGKRLKQKGDPIFGFELKQALKKNQVKLKSRFRSGKGNQIHFDQDPPLQVDNVIWATGFKPSYDWLKLPGLVDQKGKPLHEKGVSPVKGIYFLGLPWQHRRGSSLLQGVGEDAQYIYHHLMSPKN